MARKAKTTEEFIKKSTLGGKEFYETNPVQYTGKQDFKVSKGYHDITRADGNGTRRSWFLGLWRKNKKGVEKERRAYQGTARGKYEIYLQELLADKKVNGKDLTTKSRAYRQGAVDMAEMYNAQFYQGKFGKELLAANPKKQNEAKYFIDRAKRKRLFGLARYYKRDENGKEKFNSLPDARKAELKPYMDKIK